MSVTLDKIREKYPQYSNVPDSTLTLAIAHKYPVYLDQDSGLRADFAKFSSIIKPEDAVIQPFGSPEPPAQLAGTDARIARNQPNPVDEAVAGVQEGVKELAVESIKPKNLATTAALIATTVVQPEIGAAIIGGMGAKALGEAAGVGSVAAQQGDVKEAAKQGVNVLAGGLMAAAPLATLAAAGTKTAIEKSAEVSDKPVPETLPKPVEESPKPTRSEPSASADAQAENPPIPPNVQSPLLAVSDVPALGAIDRLRRGVGEQIDLHQAKDQITATYDAISTKAALAGREAANDVRLDVIGRSQPTGVRGKLLGQFSKQEELDLEAMTPIVQAGGDFEKLRVDAEKVSASPESDPHSKLVYRWALSNFNRLEPNRAKINDLHDAQLADESAHGIETDRVDNYVAQRYDFDVMLGANRPVILDSTGGRGIGASTQFRKQRVFPDYATAIAQGYRPKTLNIADLVEHRVRAGQQLVGSRVWVDSMRQTVNPLDNSPVVTDLIRQPKGTLVPPAGYSTWTPLPGVTVAVHDTIAPLLNALTGRSLVPKAISNVEGFLKHSTLLFDTFHVSRVLQKQAFMTGKTGYSKGLSLLEYSDEGLSKAVDAGEITVQMATEARRLRPTVDLGVAQGLNVGRFADALFKDVVQNIPGIGQFNKWVFDKLSRGVMAQSYVWAFNRNRTLFPELNEVQVARRSAKEINQYYGNLMSQGVFQSRTYRDMLRIAFLAPQWVEAMATTELKSVGQGGKAVVEAIGKTVAPDRFNVPYRVGNLARATGSGLAAYVAVTQALNYFTRGHFTWDNEEKQHKFDAWIPDWVQDSPGFFLSPLSVPAELTHDLVRYQANGKSALESAVQIAKNKESPLTRAVSDLATGKDFFGKPLVDTWERVKQAAIDIAPIPLPARALQNSYLGSSQRQMAGSLGVKIEPAKTPEQETRSERGRARQKVEDIATAAVSDIFRDSKNRDKYIQKALDQAGKIEGADLMRLQKEIQRRTRNAP